MKEEIKKYYKMITDVINRASEKLSDDDFMNLCAEVETIANAEYEARKEQINNEDASNG